MEWMLQVVDEIDDAVSTVRLFALGMRSEARLLLAGGLSIGALTAASTALGAG
jgi:hypothetical protein